MATSCGPRRKPWDTASEQFAQPRQGRHQVGRGHCPTLSADRCRPFRGSETDLHASSPPTACAVGHMMAPATRALKPLALILAPMPARPLSRGRGKSDYVRRSVKTVVSFSEGERVTSRSTLFFDRGLFSRHYGDLSCTRRRINNSTVVRHPRKPQDPYPEV